MSDFDKEAEREKLREKYGDEADDREATEQMSELLLKGATMTNAHCSDCGDPIFRYDGQEFCPTCQKPIARDAGENGTAPDSDDDEPQRDNADAVEMADPSDEARVQFGGGDEHPNGAETAGRDQEPRGAVDPATGVEPSAQSPPETEGDRPTQPAPSSQTARTPASTPTAPDAGTATRPETDSQDPPVSARTPAQSETGDIEADLNAASGLLAETLHRFAERAAATENPREAREHLEAAREAAAALEATRF